MMTRLVLSLGLAGALLAQAPPAPICPIASFPVTTLRGKITKVDIAWGQGMPSLLLEGTTPRVLLGSMRYLMQQNFNPKVGQEVEVKAYSAPNLLVAISVTLLPENTTLQLRNENGWPVWAGGGRGGWGGRGGRGGGGGWMCPFYGNPPAQKQP